MARRDVQVGDTIVTVSPLEPPAVGDRHCALLRVGVTDEMTGRPPTAAVAAHLTAPGDASARVVHQGLIGVSGRPTAAFASHLATTGRVELDITTARFAPRRLAVAFACGLRRLASPATTATLTLDSSAGLLAGQRLLAGSADGSRAEFGVIAAIGPGANEVTLLQPLAFPYPAGSPVQPLPADQAIQLRRRPVSLFGRILKRTGAVTAPLAGASVRVSKIWRTIPPAGVTAVAELPVPGGPVPATPWDAPIASLSPPAYVDMPTGSIELENRLVDGGVTAKTLLDDAAQGSRSLRLSDAAGLGPTDVISVDADDDGRRELMEISTITPSAGPSDWARVTLVHPLARSHRPGRLVRRLLGPGAVPSKALNYDVAAGDEAVLFDAATITGTHQVRLAYPGPPAALQTFHRIDVLAATSDADGFYRLPPITRAGKIEIFVKDGGSAASKAVEFAPDYELSENRVDVTVS